jgi:hypothetical protein
MVIFMGSLELEWRLSDRRIAEAGTAQTDGIRPPATRRIESPIL